MFDGSFEQLQVRIPHGINIFELTRNRLKPYLLVFWSQGGLFKG